MKNTRMLHGLVGLSKQTFQLLSPGQQIKAVKSVLSSAAQALLEVFSLTAVIPLFFQIIDESNQSISTRFAIDPNIFSWQTVLIVVVVVFIVKNAVSLWLTRYQTWFIHEVFVTFSEQLYNRFYKQSWSAYLKDNSAEAARKIKHSPADFTTYVLQGYLTLITDAAICILMLGVLLWFNYRIVLVLLLLCLPILLFYRWFRNNILSKINKSFLELTPKANIALTQGIDSYAEAKIYQKENFFIRHFMQYNETTSQHFANLKLFTTLPARLFEIVGIICFVVVIAYSKINPTLRSDLIVLLGLLSLAMYRIVPALNRMLISISQIQAYAYSVQELANCFSSDTSKSTEGSEELNFKKSIRLKDIVFQYNTEHFLFRQLNIIIDKGDFVILEGPSGVGKTTLIHLLTGLMEDYKGQIMIDDVVLSHETLVAWQKKIGFVPQSTVVLQDTILQNVAFGEDEKDINLSRIKEALKLAGLEEHVYSLPLQLKTPVGENGLTLSGGQRQRLILARALYRNPEVLLLDEVTNQLDEDNKYAVLKMLKELSRNGTTILFASHDQVVKNFGTRIIRLKGNTVEEIESC